MSRRFLRFPNPKISWFTKAKRTIKQNAKKTGLAGIGIATLSSYSYKKHMYEKEMIDQYNYLLTNNVKLSGAYIQQRQAFPALWYIQWLIPYHQSLKICNPDGTVRQVGLGRSPTAKSFFDFTSEFVSHLTKKYLGLEVCEKSVPIECWVDFKQKFGHFPSNVNLESLKQLTMTREEAIEKKIDPSNIYTTTFGSLKLGIYGKWVSVTCNYALLCMVREEELKRIKSKETVLNKGDQSSSTQGIAHSDQGQVIK